MTLTNNKIVATKNEFGLHNIYKWVISVIKYNM